MTNVKNKVFVTLLLCLSSCAGGTRGTGANLGQNLFDSPENKISATPKYSNQSLSLFGIAKPSCDLQLGESSLKFKVVSEVGDAELIGSNDLKCEIQIPRQALNIRIVFDSISKDIKAVPYSIKTVACNGRVAQGRVHKGQAQITNGEIAIPLAQWLPASIQSFGFANPKNPQEEIVVELRPDSLGECKK